MSEPIMDQTRKPETILVTSILKRNGKEEPFDFSKLRRSIEWALETSGMKCETVSVEKILAQVITRLNKYFDGHRVPTYGDVRDLINLTFIDFNLGFVARTYMGFKAGMIQQNRTPRYGNGILVQRYFTRPDTHPFDAVSWDRRDARLTNEKGKVVFEQLGVEVPTTWSQTATNVVVSKYFRGKVGMPERESSVRQMVGRVASTIAHWGRCDGYFKTEEDGKTFEAELIHLLVNQMAAFNSPVWFNVGANPFPQCSACFINSVQDDMRSILQLAYTEGMLFKGGSGTGSNLSTLRSRQEYLNGSNGRASGPVSFMKGYDAFAGVIKSGGRTRRAAKMVILNADHPDIEEFITCKMEEEKKAWALMDAGYDGSIDGSAYASIFFQNANNSVRVSDDFMRAVDEDKEWVTHEVTTGKPSLSYRAKDLMRKIAEATWQCGDPGMQFDTTINQWHTCKASGRINASNPCSEYMFLDDSACNLASLNLMKFRREINGEFVFDVEAFKKANEIIITAMEIMVGNSSYPTPAIEHNSFEFRTLGIGYANLGALLMSRGLAYDSDAGRNLAAAITSLQSGHCYEQSVEIAKNIGPFAQYPLNASSMTQVMQMHRDASYHIPSDGVPMDLLFEARKAWDNALAGAQAHGTRNAQISVLAPTGTIAFLMDCDTTGVEPDIALVKYKWLVGGGMLKIVNSTVTEAFKRLGYADVEAADILKYIDANDTIEGAPHLKESHLSVFDCAFKPAKGMRTISYMGHLRMMAAVQPFISGAISKTVNMPHEATVEEIEYVYREAWRMGIKAVAIYRDGSKRQQALTTSKEKDAKKANGDRKESPATAIVATAEGKPRRRRLPNERKSITHKFTVGNHEGYITVGLYDDGTPGELFVTISKEGSVISGLMDSFAKAVSIGLQYGVPLDVLVNKFVHVRFEPYGFTNNPNIRIAKSIVDYLFRWLAMKFLSEEAQRSVGINLPIAIEVGENHDVSLVHTQTHEDPSVVEAPAEPQANLFQSKAKNFYLTGTFDNQSDAPVCDTCGSIMVRNASCYKCLNCGSTSGCS